MSGHGLARFFASRIIFYTLDVYSLFNRSHQLPIWQRFAAFLSLLAVLSALVVPASALAEDVRTGKLGGLCSVSSSAGGTGGEVDATGAGPHCDLCGSPSIAISPFAVQSQLCQPAAQAAAANVPFDLAARVEGLPPNRGPPAL